GRYAAGSGSTVGPVGGGSPGGASSVVQAVGGGSEGIDLAFDDLTLGKRGRYFAVAVHGPSGGSVTLAFNNVAIVGRKGAYPVSPFAGIGVYADGAVDLSLQASTIEGHSVGIDARSGVVPAVRIASANSTIRRTGGSSVYGSGVRLLSDGASNLSLTMTGSLVTGNIGRGGTPGGISAEAQGSSVLDIAVRNSTLSRNRDTD